MVVYFFVAGRKIGRKNLSVTLVSVDVLPENRKREMCKLHALVNKKKKKK